MSEVEPPLAVSGELLRGRRRGLSRFVELVTLWAFARPFVELFARGVLRKRTLGELVLGPGHLELRSEVRLLGAMSRKKTVRFPLARIDRFVFEEAGPSPSFSLGLGALVLGTAWGTGLVTWGLRSSGGAGFLALVGLVLVLLGVGLDWLLERGRLRRGPAPARLVIEPTRGAGFILRGVERRQVDRLLGRLEELEGRPLGSSETTAPAPA